MEKSTVLELSRWTASNSPNNAVWTNTFNVNTPKISEGDIIAVRNSFIDTRLIDANSIQIQEDTTLTFNFVYYLINNGLSMKYISIGDYEGNLPYPNVYNTYTEPNVETPPLNINGPDGLPYILVNADLKSPLYGKPVIETVNINIPAGVYERASLAEIITRQFESIGQPTNQQMSYGSTASQLFTNGNVYAEADSEGNFFQFTKPTLSPDPFKVVTTIQKQLYYGVISTPISNIPNIRFKHGLFYVNSSNQLVPCLFRPMTDNQYYTPIPDTDSSFIIAPFQSFDKLSNVDPLIGNTYVETPAQGSTPAVVYAYILFDAGFVGTNQLSLVYNDENGNGKFSFQYMHTPITQTNNEVCMTYSKQFGRPDPGSIFNKSISYFTAMGGIMLVNSYTKYNPLKIEEVSLLNQLGFKLTDLIPIDDLPIVFNGNNNWLSSTYNKFKYSNFKKYTTRNFASFPLLYQPNQISKIPSIIYDAEITLDRQPSIFYTSYNTDPNVDKPNDGSGFNTVQSTITEGVVASSFPVGSNSLTGHYLIELSGYNNDFINSEKLFNVKSIVGNYYFSENFAMELGFDSFIYQHRGEPISLSQIQVRILSPYTKDIVEGLGTNSSVYLQITNQIQPLQQTEQKK
jgi:hypothetical protein